MIHWFFTYWKSLATEKSIWDWSLRPQNCAPTSGPFTPKKKNSKKLYSIWLLSAQSIFPLQIPSDYTGVLKIITNRNYAQLEGKNLKLTIHLHWLIPSKMGPIEQQPLVFYSRNSSTRNKSSNFTTTSQSRISQWPDSTKRRPDLTSHMSWDATC